MILPMLLIIFILIPEINKYASDSINIDLKNNNIYLYGNASIITYENAKIQADQIIINWETNIIEARCGKDSLENLIGCPIFTENNETFNAKLIKYNLKTKKSFIKNISLKPRKVKVTSWEKLLKKLIKMFSS